MRIRALTSAAALVATIAAAGAAYAGGPFVVDMVGRTGVAQRWQDDKLTYCVDAGDLTSSVKNAEAMQWVTDALSKWTGVTLRDASNASVSTATIKAVRSSECDSVDIDITNYGKYVDDAEGPSYIIFDETGDIVALEMGEENRSSVVGLSMPIASDSEGLHITKGVAIFNGYILTSGVLASTQSEAEELFKATVLHELGHVLNLDHSQTNYDIATECERGGTCEGSQYIPTMYPELLTKMQQYPTRDDKVTISWIYPSDDFKDRFCTITGEVFDGDGLPLKGVYVTAARASGETSPLVDSRSMVSGVLKPACYGDGRYYLHGIVPGYDYSVTYEPIGSEFAGASDFEPLDNPPRGFPKGQVLSTSGETTVRCAEGGETIEMASTTIEVANPCEGSDKLDTSGDEGTGGSSSPFKCSLSAGAAASGAGAAELLMALPALCAIVARRRRASRDGGGRR
jgi:hypothetical protein